MDLKSTYNRIAKEWHEDHKADDWWKEGVGAFVALLRPGSLVLDVGCGGGTKSRYLVDRGMRVQGIDLSENMIAIAQEEVPEGVFRVMDLKDAGSIKEVFDGILMQAVLLHIPKKEAQDMVNILKGMLAPGGYFSVAVKERKPGQPEEEMVIRNDYGYPYERFFSFYSEDEVRDILKNAGMTVVYDHTIVLPHTRWIQMIGRT